MSRNAFLPTLIFCVILISAGLWTASCNLQMVLTAQVGTFLCDTDSQCPDSMFCYNYFNAYFYYSDIRGQPIAEGRWGYCSTEEYIILKDDLKNAEICSNNRDEDDDGKVDCEDPECQTAPDCRAWLQSECADGGPAETCDTRLGFPLVRNGVNSDESTCPGSVGYFGNALQTTPENVCLPRCRLYLQEWSNNLMEISDDSDFQASDDYCNQVVHPGVITDPSFEGGILKCQHLGVFRNRMGRSIQNDVCLPSAGVTDCTACTGATPRCLTVNYKERTLLAWDWLSDGTQPIGNPQDADFLKSAVYCLPADRDQSDKAFCFLLTRMMAPSEGVY